MLTTACIPRRWGQGCAAVAGAAPGGPLHRLLGVLGPIPLGVGVIIIYALAALGPPRSEGTRGGALPCTGRPAQEQRTGLHWGLPFLQHVAVCIQE